MYSYNKSIVLRLQVSAGNLRLELSTGCVRIKGVETFMHARFTRVIKDSEWCPSAQCPAFAVVLYSVEFLPDKLIKMDKKSTISTETILQLRSSV